MTIRQPARAGMVAITQPWAHCLVTRQTAMAVRAMHAANATEQQQKIFMAWLNQEASPLIGVGWSPDNERVSGYMAGRRFVALKIVEIVKTNPDFYDQAKGQQQ